MLRFICFFVSTVCVSAAVLPVEKCNLEDSACMTAAFNKASPIFMGGIPDIGIEVLDVMEMEDFKFDLSGLQFGLQDGKLKGMKNSVFDEVKFNTKKKHMDISFHLDCSVRGHYTAGGRILILPITGDGQMKLKLKNVQLKFRIDYDMGKNDEGKDIVVPKKFSFDFEVKDNANFQLTNLFNGNKELSDTMLMFLNENWQQISIEFGRPMIDVAGKKLFKNMVQFFKEQPIEEIANV